MIFQSQIYERFISLSVPGYCDGLEWFKGRFNSDGMFAVDIDWFDGGRRLKDLDFCRPYAMGCTQEPCMSAWHFEQFRHIILEEFNEVVDTAVFCLSATIEDRKNSFGTNTQPS